MKNTSIKNAPKGSFLRKIYDAPPRLLKSPGLHELIRVYEDLERTLKELKRRSDQTLGADSALRHIDIAKLIEQLSRSKKKLERKIGNTLLLEKQHLKRRLRALTDNITPKPEKS